MIVTSAGGRSSGATSSRCARSVTELWDGRPDLLPNGAANGDQGVEARAREQSPLRTPDSRSAPGTVP